MPAICGRCQSGGSCPDARPDRLRVVRHYAAWRRGRAAYLGFFAGILLYLATSDILPEAHASHPTRLTLACTIAGAGFMWLVIGLAS